MATESKISKRKRIILIVVAVTLVIAICFVTFGDKYLNKWWDNLFESTGLKSDTDADFSVTFLDVGQADSIVINYNDINILIDSGNEDTTKKVNTYLESRKVDSLDLVVATHPDSDHIGGMSDVIDQYDIDEFWMPKLKDSVVPDTFCYDEMIDSLTENDVKVVNPKAGQVVTYSDITLDVIAPIMQYNDTNPNSIVIKLEFGENSFLFTGDSTIDTESDILEYGADISSDVLKVGHHGSKTSSSEGFLEAVNPKYAVISVGENNRYDLPNSKVVNRINDLGIDILRTDESGNIIFTCEKGRLQYHTEK